MSPLLFLYTVAGGFIALGFLWQILDTEPSPVSPVDKVLIGTGCNLAAVTFALSLVAWVVG